METFHFDLAAATPAQGTRSVAIVGVVASGNLEVLIERGGSPDRCVIDISTPARGFKTLWEAVTADFVMRRSAGGLRISINDGGARPEVSRQSDGLFLFLRNVQLDDLVRAASALHDGLQFNIRDLPPTPPPGLAE